MAYEIKLTKWHAGVLIDIETREKVMKVYGQSGESRSEAISKALDDAVKDVKLTKDELAKVRDEIEENFRKRMLRREQKASGKAKRASTKR